MRTGRPKTVGKDAVVTYIRVPRLMYGRCMELAGKRGETFSAWVRGVVERELSGTVGTASAAAVVGTGEKPGLPASVAARSAKAQAGFDQEFVEAVKDALQARPDLLKNLPDGELMKVVTALVPKIKPADEGLTESALSLEQGLALLPGAARRDQENAVLRRQVAKLVFALESGGRLVKDSEMAEWGKDEKAGLEQKEG